MIDIHSHLLPTIDDGSKSFDESLEILKNAKRNGVTDIIVTPHYIYDSNYNADNKKKNTLFKKLVKFSEKIKINLYIGNEVHYNKNILNLENEYQTLGNSKYLLLELSRTMVPKNLFNDIHELQIKGYKVIIAHPERYEYFQKDINEIIPFLNKGVLFQGNIGSLFNTYGKKSNKTLKAMIKHNMIHFLATDSHSKDDGRYDFVSLLDKKLKPNIIKELMIDNPKAVLENKDITVKKYKKCKYILKNILDKYKIH